MQEELVAVQCQQSQREEALQQELDALRQTLLDSRAAELKREGQTGETMSEAQHPRPFPAAVAAIAAPAPAPAPSSDARTTSQTHEPAPPNVESSDMLIVSQDEEVPLIRAHHESGHIEGDTGSGDEESMELATPLHPTILSLADDDFLLSAVGPEPSSNALFTFSANADPTEVPLPLSPDSAPASPPVPLSALFPLPPPRPPPASTFQYSSPPHRVSSPPELSDPDALVHISADLLSRVESATQARVDAIERECEETRRALDTHTRALAEREAALEEMRRAHAEH